MGNVGAGTPELRGSAGCAGWPRSDIGRGRWRTIKRPFEAIIARGAVGGILAGLVVALWFLVVDSFAGQPFRTPLALASALFHRDVVHATVRLVATYTVLHFGVFALLGVAMAWVIAPLEAPPRFLLGLVFGVAAQEVVFYAALALTGARLTAVLPWPQVLAANMLSGVVLMAYLHRAERDQRPLGLAAVKAHPLLARGLVTGLIGAAAVALWFFVLDAAAGRPFRTPGALGSVLLVGASGGGEPQVSFGVVATYTVVHVAAFAVAGIVFVAVAEQVARAPAILLLVAMAFIILEAVVVTVLALGAEWVLGTLGWWSIAVGNLLAVLSMGWYVWETHPVLRHRLRDEAIHVHT